MNSSYTSEDLQYFKGVIESKIRLTSEILRGLKEELSKHSENSDDDTNWHNRGVEDAGDTYYKEQSLLLAGKQEKYLKALKLALTRIDNGTYGICVNSGDIIPRERLLANPCARTTINFKQP